MLDQVEGGIAGALSRVFPLRFAGHLWRAAMTARAVAMLAVALCGAPAVAGEVYTGQWGGMVPTSIEFLSASTLRTCHEDLVHQCQGPIPFTRDGATIVVEHLTSGRKWTYQERTDGAYDATYFRWDGEGGYKVLATAILHPR